MADPAAELASYATADPGAARARRSWRAHRRPILLDVAIAGFNRLSGINAILYDLNDILAAAGFDHVSADRQFVGVFLFFPETKRRSLDSVGDAA